MLPAEVLRKPKLELYISERPAAGCVHFPWVRRQRQQGEAGKRRSCDGAPTFVCVLKARVTRSAAASSPTAAKAERSKIYSSPTHPPPPTPHHHHRLKVWFRHHFVPLSKNKWRNNPAGPFHRIRLNLVPSCTSAHGPLKITSKHTCQNESAVLIHLFIFLTTKATDK